MKKIFLFVVAGVVTCAAMAQVRNPVKWNFSAKKINATTYEIHLTATMEEGWHIYSQTTPEGGPVPTTVGFNKNPLLGLEGSVKEAGKLEQRHEELFGVDVKQFSNKVDFVQTVKLKGKVKTSLIGNVEFMTCNDRECLPPKVVPFNIALK